MVINYLLNGMILQVPPNVQPKKTHIDSTVEKPQGFWPFGRPRCLCFPGDAAVVFVTSYFQFKHLRAWSTNRSLWSVRTADNWGSNYWNSIPKLSDDSNTFDWGSNILNMMKHLTPTSCKNATKKSDQRRSGRNLEDILRWRDESLIDLQAMKSLNSCSMQPPFLEA